MIEIKDFSFTYPKSSKPALYDMNADIPEGIHLLVGENGAGKTTLLFAMTGLISPQRGRIMINGKEATSMLPSEKNDIFMVDENLELTAKTIRSFAKVHSRFYPNFSEDIFNANLQAFDMTGDEMIKKLSLGNRKKAILSYAIALGVGVLLLDEPTNGLDIDSKDTLRRIIAANLSERQTVIISTHNVSEFRNLYDGLIAIHKGELQLAATATKITDILEFIVSPSKREDALYSELFIGGYNTICPVSGDSCSDIDWELLYKALMSPRGKEIISLFISKEA